MSQPDEFNNTPTDEVADGEEIAPLAETVKQYPSYSQASVAACTWVDNGKVTGKPQVNPTDLVLYKSKLGPYEGRVVGLGIQKPSGVIEDLVRIDNDNTGKGIHFNAKYRKDTSSKLAAVITSTVSLTAAARDQLYAQYLTALENRTASFIWTWWSTGNAPP